jgi:DNA-binding SARP family transcriptional activator
MAYEQGLAADDLSEDFYLGLMRCHRALGQTAEALNAYRHMRLALAAGLGIGPSERSIALAQTLGIQQT